MTIRRGLTALLLLACVAPVGCGGASAEERQAEQRYERELREYRAEVREYEREERRHERCASAMGGLRESLEELDSRLGVGLSYDEYGSEVGDVVVAYDNSDLSSAGAECLTQVGLPLENALNQYRKAFEAWDDCFDDIDCDLDAIDGTLQHHWGKASVHMTRVGIGLQQLKPGLRPERPEPPATGD